MPRVDIVDDLNDTLKSDVADFFRGRADGSREEAGASALATPSSASDASQKRADDKVTLGTMTPGTMTPLMIVAAVATIATFAALLYVTMSSSFAGPGASEENVVEVEDGEDDDGEVEEEEE